MAEPMNPLAGKAGPGKFSVREDLPPSTQYGERKQMQEMIQGAPTRTTGAAAEQISKVQTPIVPLYAPTQRPNEPVTTGIRFGEGAGPEVLGAGPVMPQEKVSDILAKMLPYDQTGEIGILYQRALSRGM